MNKDQMTSKAANDKKKNLTGHKIMKTNLPHPDEQ
jgi:hypothetical protein